MSIKSLIALSTLPLMLAGCGSDSDPEASGSTANAGVFVDSAVANIAYETETHSGFTSLDGEFDYEDGETVTFSVGGIDLPSVAATGKITPFDLADTLDIDDTTVLNIARFLQSLDSDGDPSNGITISDTAHSTAEAMEGVDFSADDFASDSDVINLVANSGSSTVELVSVVVAKEHFVSTLESTFTAYLINGKTFGVSSDGEVWVTELVFNTDGTGTIEFEVEQGDSADINGIVWEVNGEILTFKETDSYGDTWDWVFEASSASQTNAEIVVDFDVSVTENGEEYSGYEWVLTHQIPQ